MQGSTDAGASGAHSLAIYSLILSKGSAKVRGESSLPPLSVKLVIVHNKCVVACLWFSRFIIKLFSFIIRIVEHLKCNKPLSE
jgi:hypothetical protein